MRRPAGAKAGGPGQGSAESGFSVMEVLVALIVGAILSASLIGLQGHVMYMSRSSEDMWANINFAQDILAKRFPDKLFHSTGMWLPWSSGDGDWRLSRVHESNQRADWIMLQTKIYDSELSWVWPPDPN